MRMYSWGHSAAQLVNLISNEYVLSIDFTYLETCLVDDLKCLRLQDLQNTESGLACF